ncbi:hypothetical protein [Actinophytocola xanthii]|uniref:Uncharacterized protein n=1 Tax=Actinophytocola xanthii TaxID=1912961 RepID=A0A1Q8CTJ9_9PSEU|nr:hypothetical protein [Actinophytocola xanthii]OLF17670.1 hypothetical protein BU204_10695 [Actinophytocola xanthii]
MIGSISITCFAASSFSASTASRLTTEPARIASSTFSAAIFLISACSFVFAGVPTLAAGAS